MNIEVVEFYPIKPITKTSHAVGTLHVYLIDLEMDLRGVFLRKANKSWFVASPKKFGIDPETKEKVLYPIVAFSCVKKQEAFQKSLISACRDYVEKYLAAWEKDLPQKES